MAGNMRRLETRYLAPHHLALVHCYFNLGLIGVCPVTILEGHVPSLSPILHMSPGPPVSQLFHEAQPKYRHRPSESPGGCAEPKDLVLEGRLVGIVVLDSISEA
jgi:hypothetical protein